ncbi:hypothetical protein BDQ17DRAFT_1517319, partial [Cyathus striatus]
MDNYLHLGEYHREFLRMYYYLLKHSHISEHEALKAFMHGFDIPFHTHLQGYLQMTDPKHHPHDPFNIMTVVEGATFLLSKNFVAPTSKPLCHLDVTLDNRVHCKGLLDNGSEIVAIRRDLWQKLNIPIDSMQHVTLEAANGSKSSSVGLLSNLKVSIGPITLYLQAQVLDDMPYNLLLGRPFSHLAQARIQDFANGDQHITLIDPNTCVAIMIHSHVSSHPD